MSNIHSFLLISKLLVLLKYLKYISFSPVRPQRSRNISSGPGCPSLLLTVLIDLRLLSLTSRPLLLSSGFGKLSPDFTQSLLLFPIPATNSITSPEQPSPYLAIRHLQTTSTVFWSQCCSTLDASRYEHVLPILLLCILSPLSNKLLLHLWPTSLLSDLTPTMKWCNLLSV